MSNYKIVLVLIVILSIAGFLRLYQITTVPPGLYPDEAIGGNQGLEAFRTGNFKLFYPENNGRSGLFINLQGLSAGVLGANSPSQILQGKTWEGKPWTLRFPSAILGILTVLGLYFLAKELFEDAISFSPKPRSQLSLVSDPQSDQAGEDKRVSRPANLRKATPEGRFAWIPFVRYRNIVSSYSEIYGIAPTVAARFTRGQLRDFCLLLNECSLTVPFLIIPNSL